MSDVAESIPSGEEEEQIAALLRGDERAFLDLVRRLTPPMVRIAMGHVSSTRAACPSLRSDRPREKRSRR